MPRGRPKNMENLFNPAPIPKATQQGAAGYDNARENIDPNIKTKAISTQEVHTRRIVAPDSDGIRFYKSDGVSEIARLTEDGHWIIKGRSSKSDFI